MTISDAVTAPGVPAAAEPALWTAMLVVASAGLAGGLINALTSGDNRVVFPSWKDGTIVLGVIGNLIVGAFAAVTTWGLYGPFADTPLLGGDPAGSPEVVVTLATFIGGALAGAGGARVVTTEVDKRFLQAAAAESQVDESREKVVRAASPIEALDIARANKTPASQGE